MKKIKAIKIIKSGEVYLKTSGGGFVPSLGGFMTYDNDWLSGVGEIEDIEVESGIFDVLPDLVLESCGAVKDDDFIYV